MAEGTLFGFAGKMLEVLASLAGDQISLAWGFKEEFNKLTETASFIQSGLLDAEQQQNNNNPQVTLWLKELRDVLYDVEDLLDDVSTYALRRKLTASNGKVKEVCLFFSKSNRLAYSLKMGHRVKVVRERLDSIADNRAKFKLSDRPLEVPLVVRERDQTHSFVREQEIIGRDDDKRIIVQLLLQSGPEENVSVVPIVGIGGLGKTTLAQMIFRDGNVVKHFQLKMWVCVSEKFELKVIVEKIIEAATGSKPDRDLQLETLQNRLRDNISGMKYLLVLDDVWNEDLEQWRSLKTLLLDGAGGSSILITTRSEVVARITGTVSSHVLRGLSRSESWSLLKQMACKEESSESIGSRLEAIGMEIVDKCSGVPLALRAIGRVLYTGAEAEWIKVKNNVHIHIAQSESGIMPILKLSYDHLPSHLKQCFAYCSLFGKDTMFSVTKLIRVWIALGFIQPLSGDEDLEDVAYEYFKDLVWRSFLQCGSIEYFKVDDIFFTMHDLMHDLACSVAGIEYCIADSKAENVHERTHHVAFEHGLDSSWEIPNTLLKATKLRSFIPIKVGHLNVSTLSKLMSNFKYLRMLNLSGHFQILPDSIGKLKHLKELDLSVNGRMVTLPSSLSRLQNLKRLDLSWCKRLESLPSKTSRLVSLIYLDIEGCNRLGYMPRGLGNLTCLRRLSKFVVGRKGNKVGELEELNELNKLEGSLQISGLGNAGIPKPGSAYLKHKLNLKSIELSWNRRIDDVIDIVKAEMIFECLQPHRNLEELMVDEYPGGKISRWLSSMTNLTKLWLMECSKCKHLPSLHLLSSLKVLTLSSLETLEYVSEFELQNELVSAKSTTTFFPSLEKLRIGDCPNLKGWWKSSDEGESSYEQLPCFPCLSSLDIQFFPNLISMPLFPGVESLRFKETRWKPLFQPTIKMKTVTSKSSSSLYSSIFPCFSKLETLYLLHIEELECLPEEFLQCLTSLQCLSIEGCINLTSMPEGMQSLNSLNVLKINGCPLLSERCLRDIGVDWPNIAHISDIWMDFVDTGGSSLELSYSAQWDEDWVLV